QLWPRPHIPP
uniref:Bradykinin-potentiating peptide F n=1 Tax=Agkistrodon piscivorus piscivorus TaxID=8716 RepID=BPPF_AGKPI|nr:RecName: Full=Bradykinin-potentiating peptide F; Short=AppF; Short=BPP-F [Agkistrodon piscivorus piscivorus]